MAAGEETVVRHLFESEEWQTRLSCGESGTAKDCWQNVYTFVLEHPAWKGRVCWDEFSQAVVKRQEVPTGSPPGRWTAEDDQSLGIWLQQQQRCIIKSLGTISSGVQAAAQSVKFHPVREWLDGLTWDEVPRLEEWLHDCFGVKRGPYASAVGRYFLLNMVARVYDPGCIMRTVPVLEGRQERGKSTALRILADPWFSDAHLDLSTKDPHELIQGVWLQEIPEMHAFNRAEANRVKQFISQREDTWVPKYVRNKVIVPRQVCIAGSTNEGLYLKDWTGNTRFHPFRCEEEQSINLDALTNMREQLFAEAVVKFRAGARRYPTPEENDELFEPQQAARLIEHPWMEPIVAWLASHSLSRVTMRQVLGEACKVETSKMTLANTQDAGRIMQALGWERKREPKGDRGWYYERPARAKVTEFEQRGADEPPF